MQEASNLIFHQELGGTAIAELLAVLDEGTFADLLADRQSGAELSLVVGRGDLEQIEIERAPDRFTERRSEKTGGNTAGGVGERGALPCPQLIDRAIEDDEREDVRLFEWRIARELQSGRFDSPLEVHVGSDP